MFDPVTYRSMQESIRPSPELVSRAVRSARPRRTVMLRPFRCPVNPTASGWKSYPHAYTAARQRFI